jgi:hypothetical protein
MTKLKLLSAALIATAMLTTPAMARENHVTSQHRAEDANASPSYIGGGDGFRGDDFGGGFAGTPDDGGYGNRASGLRGGFRGGRDVWGHWGAYYGPMIPMI